MPERDRGTKPKRSGEKPGLSGSSAATPASHDEPAESDNDRRALLDALVVLWRVNADKNWVLQNQTAYERARAVLEAHLDSAVAYFEEKD